MVSSELSDKKPGIVTAFRVLLALLFAGIVVVIFLFLTRGESNYDTDRATKRYDNLKKLNEDNAKKAKDYAVLDKDKGTYQLPIETAITLTTRDLAAIAPHSAYPVVAPTPVAAPSPAAAPVAGAPPASAATATAASPTPSAQPAPASSPAAAAPSPAATPAAKP